MKCITAQFIYIAIVPNLSTSFRFVETKDLNRMDKASFTYPIIYVCIFVCLQAMGDVANNANAKNVPIRLCYHRGCHYNSLVDPHTATIGVGLGLPNHNPGAADRNLVGQAVLQSEKDAVEKTMLEDKIRATGKFFMILNYQKSKIIILRRPFEIFFNQSF